MPDFRRMSSWLVLFVSLALASVACNSGKQQQKNDAEASEEKAQAIGPPPGVEVKPRQFKRPRRIILMIGDGMGVPAVSAAAYAKGAPLEMLEMPHVSLMRTHEFEYMTTDSAASATALSTGHKTHFEGVSVKPGTTTEQEEQDAFKLETMAEAAERAGWRTGLIATSRIVHATPAAFASHRKNRRSYEAIARDMVASNVDVMLGAGWKFFNEREDGEDLLAKMRGQGYTVATSAEDVRAAAKQADRLVGLMHEKDMPSVLEGGRAMPLSEMTQVALDVLDRDNPEGFFLMVEGSQIDWEEHDMNAPGAVAEALDFDEAVGVARRYAEGRDDTLVIVTADHETGGLALLDSPAAAPYLEAVGGLEAARAAAGGDDYPAPVQYYPLGSQDGSFGPSELADPRLVTSFGYLSVASRASWRGDGAFFAAHTAAMVPLFAQGVGAEFVSQIQDNADLGRFIRAAILSETDGALEPVERAILQQREHTFAMERPRNVILMVGDGMGVSTVTAAQYARGELAMTKMPVKGLVATHGVDRLVNDSAATATALATGQRTRYHAVGVVPDGEGFKPAETVLERAEARGLRTGLITTTTLTHATPAAFYAHHPNRREEEVIAGHFVDLPSRVAGADGVDLAFAGGESKFSEEQIATLAKRGVYVSTKWEDVPAPADRQVLRLLQPRALPEATERRGGEGALPSLEVMTRSALTTLSQHPEGFFLVVEGGQIDWALHEMERGPRLIHEVEDFDGAVAAALEFAGERGDTLVIVTADHDHTLSVLDNHYGFSKGRCGAAKRCDGEDVFVELPVAASVHRGEGLKRSDLQGEWSPPRMLLQYAWLPQAASKVKKRSGPHAAHFVPLFAYGPGASSFSGFQQQPEVGQALLRWAAGEAP